ncbi:MULTISPECIES: VanZ family protein [Cohnella]|uniref:VanZ family protein n=1 Tax=Cohnella TaxID=329857 RepID=UPI0009BA1E27|nr:MULTISPECIES: VanZ family protein [Cohnella]MBN2982492.1 VanZ family protein [Cohnella algarum]
MLESYLFPISYAFLSFPAAALLFTLPFLIVQYRRYGYVHKVRAVTLFLFLLYLLNAVYLILLPLPATIHNDPPAAESYAQWIPFHFVQDILNETAVDFERPATYWLLLRERAFLQVVFNVLLTVPFGIFLRYYFRARWATCLAWSFGLSLFFEVTQVTGIYGIYDYPYRLFDVDDLLANTAGGIVGYVAAEWLSRVLPAVDKLDENVDLSKKRVIYTRRGLAFMLDWMILLPAHVAFYALGIPVPYIVLIVFYFIVLPYFTEGRTFGKWMVRIRLKGKGERIGIGELGARYGLLYVLAGGPNVLFVVYGVRYFPKALLMLYAVGLFALNAAFAVHLLKCLFNRNRRLFYEVRSGTSHAVDGPGDRAEAGKKDEN